jgi:hypothetical protein
MSNVLHPQDFFSSLSNIPSPNSALNNFAQIWLAGKTTLGSLTIPILNLRGSSFFSLA